MEDAVKMDPSDINDIQQEIMQLRIKMKELEKKNNQKLSGFLLKGDE